MADHDFIVVGTGTADSCVAAPDGDEQQQRERRPSASTRGPLWAPKTHPMIIGATNESEASVRQGVSNPQQLT
jgi:hypothetical protein